jgi:NTE family protein
MCLGSSHRFLLITILLFASGSIALGSADIPDSVQSTPARPKVALVLSGGGARGLATIGVLKVLEENNIPIDLIVGTSMGSVIGGFYAAGYSPEQLRRIADSTNWAEVINYEDESARREMFLDQKLTTDRSVIVLRFNGLEPIIPSAYSAGQKLTSYLNYYALQALYHPNPGFGDFRIPFRAVTTDIISGKQFVFKSGDLAQALRASVAVPLLFSSVHQDSMQLLDGGILSNLPVDVARREGASIIITVDVTSPLRTAKMLNAPWEFAEQLMGVMMQEANKLSRQKSDVVIRPSMEERTSSDFSNPESIITTGEAAARSVLPSIRVLLAKFQISSYDSTVPAALLAGVQVNGLNYLDSGFAQRELNMFIGTRADEVGVRRVAERLLMLYRERGYSLARILRSRLDTLSRLLHIDVDEGIIYKLEIVGTTKTKDYIIWREIAMDGGDIFKIDIAQQGLRNIYSTGLFESAMLSVRSEGGANIRNIVTISVKERSTELVRIGLRLDSERNFQPSVDIRDENFLGIGSQIGLRAFGGQRNQSFVADFKVIRIFDSFLTFDLRGYSLSRDVNVYQDGPSNDASRFTRERVGEYREVREGASLAVGTQLERLGSATIEGRLENHSLFNLFATPVANQNYSISSVRFATNLDTQDRFPFPTDGINFRLLYESALYKLGDAIGFTKLFFSYDQYKSLAKGHTLHSKILLGSGDKTLPLSEQFSIGGQGNFFGYPEDNQRGAQIIVGSLEYQYRLPIAFFFDAYAKIRYDLGSIWAQPEQVRFEDLKHGIGLTFGLDTPIGPAEFSVGKAFYVRKDILERPLSLGPTTLYFSLGYPIQ